MNCTASSDGMYEPRSHHMVDRIASLYQPHVRPKAFAVFRYFDTLWNLDTPSLDWLALSSGRTDPICIVETKGVLGRKVRYGMPLSQVDPNVERVVGEF